MAVKVEKEKDKDTVQQDVSPRLEADLEILEAMAALMPAYLKSDTLYYPLPQASFPRLTLGGYLLREHRLEELSTKLDEQSRQRLSATLERFQDAVASSTVRLEQKGTGELRERLHQWQAHLDDLEAAPDNYADYYAASVEVRAMIEALLERLRQPPHRPDPELDAEVAALDERLQNIWQPGDFVWPEEWQEVYPQEQYWWLYGRPVA